VASAHVVVVVPPRHRPIITCLRRDGVARHARVLFCTPPLAPPPPQAVMVYVASGRLAGGAVGARGGGALGQPLRRALAVSLPQRPPPHLIFRRVCSFSAPEHRLLPPLAPPLVVSCHPPPLLATKRFCTTAPPLTDIRWLILESTFILHPYLLSDPAVLFQWLALIFVALLSSYANQRVDRAEFALTALWARELRVGSDVLFDLLPYRIVKAMSKTQDFIAEEIPMCSVLFAGDGWGGWGGGEGADVLEKGLKL
jgi:hypothetical protein